MQKKYGALSRSLFSFGAVLLIAKFLQSIRSHLSSLQREEISDVDKRGHYDMDGVSFSAESGVVIGSDASKSND
jgi:hypothetical protein